MPTPPEYLVRVRQNSTLNLLAEVDDYTHATVNPRFNDIGTWVVDISKTSPWAQYLTSFANGLIFERDIHDGNGFVSFLSGPVTKVRRKGGPEQMLQISGSSDEQYLADRQALPVTNYPYYSLFANGHTWKLNDTSGTVAADSASVPSNGTYVGTVALNKPGLIDDPAACALPDGTTGYVSIPTTVLAGGNGAFYVNGWGMLAANPAGNICMWSIGTNAAGQLLELYVNTSGMPFILVNGAATITSTTAVPLNTPFMLSMLWDGTNLVGFLNGAIFGQSTPGARTITFGGIRFGDSVWQAAFWPGYLAYGAANNIGGGQLYTAWTATIAQWYVVGVSREAALFSDVGSQPFAHASTALIYYAQHNAGIGTALPAARATLTMAADPALGSATYAAARFANTLKLLQVLALQSTPELGFRVVQVGSALQFQVYQPTDQTNNAKFSTDLGNLFSYEWELARPTANHFWVGGAGTGTNRLFVEVEDATSVATYGRIEGFVDRRNVGDIPTLKGYGQAELARASNQSNLTIQPQDSDSLQVWRDYNLGDKVAAITEEGNTVSDLIRGLQIEISPDNILVTPAIGSPSQGEINATLLLLRKKLIQVSDLLDQVQGST